MQDENAKSMVRVSHLTKRFAAAKALDDVSFEIQRGEIVGFLGPNGAGKTTLMRILSCYLAATEGSVFIDNRNIFFQSLQVRQGIGYLPETVALYPELRVDEYLLFRAKIKGVPRRKLRARLAEVKARCGLSEVAGRIIGQLSRGYWQRVAFADCLIHDPELLILDEPTTGLDPNQIRAMRALIQGLGRRYTILLSTHSLSEASMLCQRVLIFNQGKIVAADSPNALIGLLQGNPCIVTEIYGPRPEVLYQLKKLAGVAHVVCQSGEKLESPAAPAAWHSYLLEATNDAAAREAVCGLAMQNQWPLRELRAERQSLEDVFTQLTAAKVDNGGSR